MAEANTLPGSYHCSCASDYLSEEVQIHGVPLTGLCSLQAVTIVLLPQAREVCFDDVVEHDRQHVGLECAIFGVGRPSPSYNNQCSLTSAQFSTVICAEESCCRTCMLVMQHENAMWGVATTA